VSCGHTLVVDDDAHFRALVSALFSSAGLDTRCAETGAEALALAREERPDLVVLDVRLADISGYAVCRELREMFGAELPIMFLSGARTESFDRVGGLLLGADDYVVKPFDPDELVARARALLRPSARPAASKPPQEDLALTPREAEILQLLSSGFAQSAIAERLVISPKTVSTHIQRVLAKLGVHSRAQAVAEAYRRGLAGNGNSDAHGDIRSVVPAT
jgi:DNA-binding response OmpR family regulator